MDIIVNVYNQNKKSIVNIQLINILQTMVDDPDEFVQSYAAEKIKDIFDEGNFTFECLI